MVNQYLYNEKNILIILFKLDLDDDLPSPSTNALIDVFSKFLIIHNETFTFFFHSGSPIIFDFSMCTFFLNFLFS